MMNENISYSFVLDGMCCASCATKIEENIKKKKDFEKVRFSFATKKVQVKSGLSKEETKKKIQEIVDKIEEGIQVEFDEKKENLTQKKSEVIKKICLNNRWMFLGMLLIGVVFLFEFSKEITFASYLLGYLLVGKDVIFRALKNIKKKQFFDEYFLMTIATLGAIFIGEIMEAVMVMFFYKIGEIFQDYAVDHSRNSIQELLSIKADHANIVENGIVKIVSPESLHIGDVIIVKAGEKIPVDGIILEGHSYLDLSALTGESLPKEKKTGDEVLSGMLNIDRILHVKVLKTYENSTVAKILELVENATSKKAKTEQFITRFAKIYTPIVVVSAVLLAIVPPMIGVGSFREWISRALIFLVISCPCALVLSVPLSYFAGLGKASRKGILIKGGNYLEELNKINTFVFDKTGTLTKGNFRVKEVIGEDTLRLAAAVEQFSTHPIAKSIQKAYGKETVQLEITDLEEIFGEGMRGNYLEKQLLVGNERLLRHYEIPVERSEHIGTSIHVALGGNYVGVIYIEDELKAGVKKLITSLKENGSNKTIMLTGDQDNIALKVAQEIGIDHYYSQLMPQDKLTQVEKQIQNGNKVLFVGDGMNDAPVLMRSNIGVAMGALGSDAAIEAADIVLMTDDPTKILEAIKIAKTTKKIVMENIIFALGIKVFFLSMGAFGIATMYEAIFADVGVTVLAVLNAMRILKK